MQGLAVRIIQNRRPALVSYDVKSFSQTTSYFRKLYLKSRATKRNVYLIIRTGSIFQVLNFEITIMSQFWEKFSFLVPYSEIHNFLSRPPVLRCTLSLGWVGKDLLFFGLFQLIFFVSYRIWRKFIILDPTQNEGQQDTQTHRVAHTQLITIEKWPNWQIYQEWLIMTRIAFSCQGFQSSGQAKTTVCALPPYLSV